MKHIFVPAVCAVAVLFILGAAEAQRLNRRRTTTTTTETPLSTLAEREANLLRREESLNAREAKFREREVNLTLREDSIRQREEAISIREDNIKIREYKGDDVAATTPAPDYSLVRIDKRTGKLVDIGSTESCPENMRFFAIPGSKTEGTCDCDYHQCQRPFLYSKKYDQCFPAWSQGPCEQGEWYTYNDTLHPVCLKNKCPSSLALRTSKYYFQDPDDGECYETTTKGYCQNEGETLMPTSDDPFPKCRTHTLCFPLSFPAQQECVAGNKRHLEGFCE